VLTSPNPSANGSQASTILFLSEGSRRQNVVAERLAQTGLRVVAASDVTQALQLLASRPLALCLIDLAGERSPLAAIRAIRSQHPHTPIAGLFDASHPLRATEAIHAGAIDLLPWPFDEREATTVLANARDVNPIDGVATGGSVLGSPDTLIAQSPAMRRVTEMVKHAARTRSSVCISGEAGTGRTLVARTIHQLGNNSGNRPFIVEDCAGDPPHELERRLFGAQLTAPPAAAAQRNGTDQITKAGALYRARGGTLLLVNLIEMPARIQARLARLLRDREAVVIDAKAAVVELDVQTIATFDTGVDGAVSDGRLRSDLYKQIAQIRIDVPSLRRRREDIPLLAVHLLKQMCAANQVAEKHLSRSVVQVLSALPWSGNATELQTLLTTLVKSIDRPVIHLEDLLEHARLDGGTEPVEMGSTLRDAKARFERECISAVLARHHGRVPEAAKALGIQRTNLYRKIRQLNVARSLLSARK